MYKVIKYFTDLQDNSRPYNVGDIYPRKGLTVSEERIKELSGSNNKQNTPLIEEVKAKTKSKSVAEDPVEVSDVTENTEDTAEETKSSRRKRK